MRTLLAALTALMLFAAPVVAGYYDATMALSIAGDHQKAFRTLRPPAGKGVADAQFKIGLMYAEGEGVLEDFMLTYAWWSIAAT